MTEMLTRTRQMLDAARTVSSRWGITIPQNPEDPMKEIRIGLRRSMIVAMKQSFTPVYPDDHSWRATGLSGISVARLKEDDGPSLMEKSSEEWGVAALVKGFDCFIIIPIACDLDEPFALKFAEFVRSSEGSFLDLEEVVPVLSRGSKGDEEEQDVSVAIISATWSDIRDFSQDSILPLSEAVFFRRPVIWDLYRAKLSDASCPALAPFSKSEFYQRYFRSVRFDRKLALSAIEMLASLSEVEPNFNNNSGINWFNLVCDSLNSLGIGRRFEGLSVILHVQVFHRKDETQSDDLPSEILDWEMSSVMNICVAYGLDPVQASYLEELVGSDGEAFHSLESTSKKYYSALAVTVIPDIHLAGMKATVTGRNADAYDALVSFTKAA